MIWKLNFDHWLQWLVNGTVFGFVFVFPFIIFASVFEETVLNLGISDNSGLKLYLILTPSGCCPVSTLELSEMVCDQTLMRSGAISSRNVKDLPIPIRGAQWKLSPPLWSLGRSPVSTELASQSPPWPKPPTSSSMGNLCIVREFIFTFEIKKKNHLYR